MKFIAPKMYYDLNNLHQNIEIRYYWKSNSFPRNFFALLNIPRNNDQKFDALSYRVENNNFFEVVSKSKNESIVKIGKIEFDGEGRAKIATQRSEIIYVVNLVHGHRFRHVSREGEGVVSS